MNEKYVLSLKDLVEFSNNLIYMGSYEKMSCLLNYNFNKNYYEYSKIIYSNICSDKFTNNKVIFNNNMNLNNPFEKILFVVHDKQTLLKNISDKGYTITQGPPA
jgi:hypothetical protein